VVHETCSSLEKQPNNRESIEIKQKIRLGKKQSKQNRSTLHWEKLCSAHAEQRTGAGIRLQRKFEE
jgi:hypothetical protein